LEEKVMHPLSLKVMAWSWGLFGTVTFAACVVYGLVVPRAFHASQLLEQILPGFRWLTPGSVLLGIVETFVYGAYAGLVFSLIHNAVLRRSE
jgi:hypothetical protein